MQSLKAFGFRIPGAKSETLHTRKNLTVSLPDLPRILIVQKTTRGFGQKAFCLEVFGFRIPNIGQNGMNCGKVLNGGEHIVLRSELSRKQITGCVSRY
jgi:hypothetical protein